MNLYEYKMWNYLLYEQNYKICVQQRAIYIICLCSAVSWNTWALLSTAVLSYYLLNLQLT